MFFNKLIDTDTLMVYLYIKENKFIINSVTKSIQLSNERHKVKNLVTFVKNANTDNIFAIDKIESIK